MPEPYALSLVEMAARIGRKKLSPMALAESILKRIDSVEPGIQAWVNLDRESVLKEARRKEKELSRESPTLLKSGFTLRNGGRRTICCCWPRRCGRTRSYRQRAARAFFPT